MLELKEDKMNMGIIAPRGGGQKKKIKREGRGQELQVLWGDNMMVVRGVSGQTILLWGHAKASRIYEKWWDPFICHLVVHHFPSPNQFAPPSSLQLGSLGGLDMHVLHYLEKDFNIEWYLFIYLGGGGFYNTCIYM